MRIGIVGCGYVLDHYMATMDRHPEIRIVGVTDINRARLANVSAFYGLKAYPDLASLLSEESVEIIVNLTSIEAHGAVTRSALEAGKHVYSEKPFVTDLTEAHDLAALAKQKGLRLSCAPSNALSATSQTMWKIVEDGAIGDVRMAYAEFDDNPIYLMSPEGWRSRSGAPWPYLHEYEMGCTWEHVGYHLTWMCAIFGPVRHVTAFSKRTLPDKTSEPLDPADTPDFSVACLDFHSGVVGRITCSIAAPYDHRMRIIGNKGIVHADTYRHYECPVYLEPFSKLTLNARKARSVRTNSVLQWLTGVNGSRVPLVPYGNSAVTPSKRRDSILAGFRRRQVGQQDKTIGVAELGLAIMQDRPHFPSLEFTLHLTELTLAIQAAGADGASHAVENQFDATEVTAHLRRTGPDYRTYARFGWPSRVSEGLLDRLHRH